MQRVHKNRGKTMNPDQKNKPTEIAKNNGYKCTMDGENWTFSENKKCPYCLEVKNAECAHAGWWFVRFKNKLPKDKRKNNKICDSFEDFAFYNGSEWYISEYDVLGFYVSDVIREDKENN
jgi:hypothetical protein